MKFLIVDDSTAMRRIIRRTLQQAGFGEHEVEEAGNAIEALSAIDASPPDLVLSDWNMPEMTGMELLEKMTERGASVKFGFVTSEGTPEMRKRAEDAGALFVISKPFTVDAFQKALSGLV